MAIHEQIESTDGFSKPVGTAEFVTEWWEHAAGGRLPGEEGEFTVFAVEFWDGCVAFEYTQGSVFERVSELGFGPVEVWRNPFVAAHAVEMAYIVRCVDSAITVAEAVELVTRLVVAAPAGMVPVGRGALEHAACFLGEHALEPVTMSFGEWVKTRELAENGGSLSSNIP